MDHPAVVTALMCADRFLALDEDDGRGGAGIQQAVGYRQPDDAAADDGEPPHDAASRGPMPVSQGPVAAGLQLRQAISSPLRHCGSLKRETGTEGIL